MKSRSGQSGHNAPQQQEFCRQEDYRQEISRKVERIETAFERFSQDVFRELRVVASTLATNGAKLEAIEKLMAANKELAQANRERRDERCEAHEETTDKLADKVDKLEAAEHRRKGMAALVAALAGLGGGVLAKLWPFGVK